MRSVWTSRAYLRGAYRLGHAVEDSHALSAAARRERLFGCTDTAVDVLPVVHHPDVSRRVDAEVGLHLQAATYVAAGRRNLFSRMHTRRAVLGPYSAQLRNGAARISEVRNPNVVVAVHHHRPRSGKSSALERRSGEWRTVRTQQCNAASVSSATLLLRHGLRQVIRGRRNPVLFQAHAHIDKVRHAQQARAKPIGHPDVALAVDVHPAVVDSGGEVLSLARIRGGKSRNVGEAAVGNPNPILLVDGEMKWRFERLAWLCAFALTHDSSLGPVALGEVHQLALLDA